MIKIKRYKLNNSLIKYYKSLSQPIKATVWFTICNVVLYGISFVSAPIFTRLLPDAEYGKLSLYYSFQQLFLIFATFEIHVNAYQRGTLKYKKDALHYTYYTQLLLTIISALAFILSIFAKDTIERYTKINVPILLFMFAYIFFQPSYNMWMIRKRSEYEYKMPIVLSVTSAIANVMLGFAFIKAFGANAQSRYTSTVVVHIALGMCFYVRNVYSVLDKKINLSKLRSYWQFNLRFSISLIPNSLSYLALAQADRMMIGIYVGEAEVAYYSIAFSIANVISIFQNAINIVMTPWIYERLEEKNGKKINSITSAVLVFDALIILLFIILAPEIIKFFF